MAGMEALLANSLDPESYRKKLALQLAQSGLDASAIRSPTQGYARMAQALLAGLEFNDISKDERAAAGAVNNLPGMGGAGATAEEPSWGQKLARALGFGGGAATTPDAATAAPASAPMPGLPRAGASRASLSPDTNRIYSNDEPSPLDPPSGRDKDLMIRTIYGEAAREPAQGQAAVANVIRNRAVAGIGGDNPTDVVTAKNQFEPWNTAGGRARMMNIPADQYEKLGQTVDRAYSGLDADPTRGATHFYAPVAQAALGRNAPAWAQGQPSQDIGGHRFIGGAPEQPPQQMAFAGEPQPPMAPPQMPAPVPPMQGGGAPQLDPAILAQMRGMALGQEQQQAALPPPNSPMDSPMAGATPSGGQPQPGAPVPGNGGVAQIAQQPARPLPGPQDQGRTTPTMDPQTQAQIRALWANPATRPMALQLYQQFASPNQFDFVTAGDTVYKVNKRTGAIEAAAPSNKPMTVGAEDRLVNPATGQIIVDGQRKAPPGYEWNTAAPGKALTPIPGGPESKLPGNAGGQLALMDSARVDFSKARGELERPWSPVEKVQGSLGVGDIGRAQRTVSVAIEATLRAMSGAAVPEQEVSRYKEMFMPNNTDTPETAKQKLNLLDQFMTNAKANILQGHATNTAADTTRRPQSAAAAPDPLGLR